MSQERREVSVDGFLAVVLALHVGIGVGIWMLLMFINDKLAILAGVK